MKENEILKLKILQKAREFCDAEFLNENLLDDLLNSKFHKLESQNGQKIAEILNELIEAKNKARLSN